MRDGPDIAWTSAALAGCVHEPFGHPGANHAPPARWRPSWRLDLSARASVVESRGMLKGMTQAPDKRVIGRATPATHICTEVAQACRPHLCPSGSATRYATMS